MGAPVGSQVRLIGVEAGGEGVNTAKHAATLTMGTPGVLHGSFSYLLQDSEGQVIDPHSISAGCALRQAPVDGTVCIFVDGTLVSLDCTGTLGTWADDDPVESSASSYVSSY